MGMTRGRYIMVLGLRGIEGVQGGIETHARMLYPLLARMGYRIEVIQRSPYYPRRPRRSEWLGIRLTYLWSPRRQGLETGVHTLLGVLYAAIRRPDILHLHAVGPGLLTPLARLLGLRVVLTCHAPDYERDKFPPWQKRLLRAGEWLGVTWANRPIAVSEPFRRDLERRYRTTVACVPNGTPPALRASSDGALRRFGLKPGRYVLSVGRLDPVKRHLDLIEAFERARISDWKLVLVGGLESLDNYSRSVCLEGARSHGIVLTGYQTGLALRELYTHAGLFVLASSLEGHPIALLEALGFGVPVAASAIPANLALGLPNQCYFPAGDIEALTERLRVSARFRDGALWQAVQTETCRRFSWRNAALSTKAIYELVGRPAVRAAAPRPTR